jgi:MSHA pilin protein MshA
LDNNSKQIFDVFGLSICKYSLQLGQGFLAWRVFNLLKARCKMKRNVQSGFTLIELVMVIVVLGILAATALPKFANLSGNARYSTIKGLQGAVNSAVAVASATYLVQNSTTITLSDGTSVSVNTGNGFPTGASTGIGAMITLSSDFSASYSAASATFTLGSCTLTYTASTGTSALTGTTNNGTNC